MYNEIGEPVVKGTILVVTKATAEHPSRSWHFYNAEAEEDESNHRLIIRVDDKIVGQFDTANVKRWQYLMEMVTALRNEILGVGAQIVTIRRDAKTTMASRDTPPAS